LSGSLKVAAACVLAGLAVGVTVEAIFHGYGALAGAVTVAGAAVFLAHRWKGVLLSEIQAGNRLTAQAQAMAALPQLPGVPMLPWSDWALAPDVILRIIGMMRVRNWTVAVECGSGLSTVILAQEFKARGRGHVYAIEHDAEWAALVRSILAERAVLEWATVITAPLEPVESDGMRFQWYSTAALAPVRALPKIDILVVDGPKRDTGPLARYPALPTFFRQLGREYMVILDDGRRVDETSIAARWNERYKTNFALADTVRGQWETIA
jgi:hypothetical protein